jgi:peptidoglycan/LPS O-acetylase OafA/YrhL
MVIVLTLALDTTWLSRVLSHPTLVLLGDASYALYILHIPVRLLLERFIDVSGLTIAQNVLFPIYVCGLIIVCVLVYQYIEYPARNWLRTNPHLLSLMLLDIVLIVAMARFGFFLRFGNEIEGFVRMQRLILRVGPVIFFLFLLGFRFYKTASWRSFGLAVLSGAVFLAGFMHYAWTSGWVEGFPQSIMILTPVLVFGSIHASRRLIYFLSTKISRTIETTREM